jgi:hypothetical protein
VLQVLSAAIGAPGFSLNNLRFVFVEGERSTNERERFQKLVDAPQTSRFMEAGNCTDVARKLVAVSQLAAETDQQLHVGGVIDRDFRTQEQIKAVLSISPVFPLPCHEIENLFLHPPTLGVLLEGIGRKANEANGVVLTAVDRSAGAWIQQRACTRQFPEMVVAGEVRRLVWETDWTVVSANPSAFVAEIVTKQSLTGSEDEKKFTSALMTAFNDYQKIRTSDGLWRECMGKQTLRSVSKELGFSAADFLEKSVVQLWQKGRVPVPEEVEKLRTYVKDL